MPAISATSSPSPTAISLAELALQKILDEAAAVFGVYDNSQEDSATWMKAYPDSTQLVHMNLPGAHDPQTWNYSQATQDSLKHITDLDGAGDGPVPPQYYRCQNSSIINMFNAGIRVLDLRYAMEITNSTLLFWHSQALMSQTASLDDVLFVVYHWLDDHPSETLMLSFQYEGSTTLYAQNDATVQLALWNTLTSPAAKKYFLQTKGVVGTLGEARGKITLLRRFDFDQLPASYENDIPGVHFSPNLWTDNDPSITLVYNSTTNATAYVEDYYETDAGLGFDAEYNIQLKYNATKANIMKAAMTNPGSLFWSFASSELDTNLPAETPEIMAVGNGTEYTPLGGVNQRLLTLFKGLRGKRVGIVMFDYFEVPSDLVPTMLSLLPASA